MDTRNILRHLAHRDLRPGAEAEILSSAHVVKGYEAAWGGGGNPYPIRPYTLTPAALESFAIRERIHVRIDGLGEDVVGLHGLGIYRRHDPAVAAGLEFDWAGATVTAQFLSLQVTGYSDVFGQVNVSNSLERPEGARVRPSAAPGGGALMPIKDCVTSLYPRFEIEDLGMIIDTGDEVVRLESRIAMVPPVGDVSRTSRRYALYDGGGRRLGELIAADIEIGALLHHVPIVRTVIPEALAAAGA